MCDPSLRPNSSSSSYLPLPLQWWWWWWWWRLRSRKRRRSLYGFFYSFLSEINAGENQKTQWDKEAVVITISYSAVCRVSALYGIRWEKKECTRRWVESLSNRWEHQIKAKQPPTSRGGAAPYRYQRPKRWTTRAFRSIVRAGKGKTKQQQKTDI